MSYAISFALNKLKKSLTSSKQNSYGVKGLITGDSFNNGKTLLLKWCCTDTAFGGYLPIQSVLRPSNLASDFGFGCFCPENNTVEFS